MTQNNGILLFAYNNTQIDYGKIALCAALMAKSNLGPIPITLATDPGTLSWLNKNADRDLIDKTFDNFIIQKTGATQKTTFHDGLYYSQILPWNNSNFVNAFELSQYENTLVIDADYLIMDNTLNCIWDSPYEILCNRKLITVESTELYDYHMTDKIEVPLYHTTALFFRKSLLVNSIFNMIKQVKSNYASFKNKYNLPDTYRNDFAFSIASHMLNGYYYDPQFILPLPTSHILTTGVYDELHCVNGKNDLTFLTADKNDETYNRLSNIKGSSVHVLNKWSISRHADTLIELYKNG